MAEERRNIVFHGRVQGVGFRSRAKYLALSLGLSGWVKNEYDGTVHMEVQGNPIAINQMLKQLQVGSYISIEWIESENIPLKDEKSFKMYY